MSVAIDKLTFTSITNESITSNQPVSSGKFKRNFQCSGLENWIFYGRFF